MPCGSPRYLSIRLVILLLWVSKSHVSVSAAAGVGPITTVREENRLHSETKSSLCDAYIPGPLQRFPVGLIPSQRTQPLLETAGDDPSEPPNQNSVIGRAFRPMGPMKLITRSAAQPVLGVMGDAGRAGVGGKGRYLQPRICRADLIPKVATTEQKLTRANRRPATPIGPSSSHNVEVSGFQNVQTYQNLSPGAGPLVVSPLPPRRGELRRSPAVEPSTRSSTRSVVSGVPASFQGNHETPTRSGLIYRVDKHGRISALLLDKGAPFTPKGSKPAAVEPNDEPKSYLFNSHQTPGKHERARNVPSAWQHAGRNSSLSTWRWPFFLGRDQWSAGEASSSAVQTSFDKAVSPGTQHGRATADFKAPSQGSGGTSWPKSVVGGYQKMPAVRYGGLSKRTSLERYSYDATTDQHADKASNFTTLSPKYRFTGAPKDGGNGIQSGSNGIIAPRAVFKSDTEMPTKSLLSANELQHKVLQHSNVPVKLDLSQSESKTEFSGVQPLIPKTVPKPYQRGYRSNNGKDRFGIFRGPRERIFRGTSSLGPLEGAGASDTRSTGNHISNPPENEMFSFQAITTPKAPSPSQGYLQARSAVFRTKTSQAEEFGKATLIPDGKEERSGMSVPMADEDFSNRMQTTSDASLGPRSPSSHGRGAVGVYQTPPAYTAVKHVPKPSSSPRPLKHLRWTPNALIYRSPRAPHSRWAVNTTTWVPWPRTKPGAVALPANGRHLYSSRPTVRGRRVKVKRLKVKTPAGSPRGPWSLRKVLPWDIMGGATLSNVPSKSQNGGKAAVGNGSRHPGPGAGPSSSDGSGPWGGGRFSYSSSDEINPRLGPRGGRLR